jgi:hypothetical protein
MIPLQTRQAYKGMLFRFADVGEPTRTYIIIGDSFMAHGRRVVKAKCIDTGETTTFTNWMFQDIEILETK